VIGGKDASFFLPPSSFESEAFGGREGRGTIVYPLHVKEVEKGRASHLFSVEVLLVALQRALGRNMVHHLVRDVSKGIGCDVQVSGFGRKRGGGLKPYGLVLPRLAGKTCPRRGSCFPTGNPMGILDVRTPSYLGLAQQTDLASSRRTLWAPPCCLDPATKRRITTTVPRFHSSHMQFTQVGGGRTQNPAFLDMISHHIPPCHT
jgi:hypothetical protein